MSVSQLARASRIDSEVSRLSRQASGLNSQLNAMANEVLAFAAFMHTNPLGEFTQDDHDKYSDTFVDLLGQLNATMAKFAPLVLVENETMTPAEFLAQYVGDVTEYSSRFDKV